METSRPRKYFQDKKKKGKAYEENSDMDSSNIIVYISSLT